MKIDSFLHMESTSQQKENQFISVKIDSFPHHLSEKKKSFLFSVIIWYRIVNISILVI